MEEEWRSIPGFPDYMISNVGRIMNQRTRRDMAISRTNYGHPKITLAERGERYTRSVAVLVASAFVMMPDPLCDQVIVLDGDLEHVEATNLAWRPRWFAWKYARQLRTHQPVYYCNLAVANTSTAVEYDSIVEAGTTEGLLFDDIWRSTYSGSLVYPSDSTFEVVERV